MTSDDNEEIAGLKTYLAKEFKTKHLENLRYFLGNKITRSQHIIFISQ